MDLTNDVYKTEYPVHQKIGLHAPRWNPLSNWIKDVTSDKTTVRELLAIAKEKCGPDGCLRIRL